MTVRSPLRPKRPTCGPLVAVTLRGKDTRDRDLRRRRRPQQVHRVDVAAASSAVPGTEVRHEASTGRIPCVGSRQKRALGSTLARDRPVIDGRGAGRPSRRAVCSRAAGPGPRFCGPKGWRADCGTSWCPCRKSTSRRSCGSCCGQRERASLEPWDSESVSRLFTDVDELTRSLLSVVARAASAGKELTERDAGDLLELSARATSRGSSATSGSRRARRAASHSSPLPTSRRRCRTVGPSRSEC